MPLNQLAVADGGGGAIVEVQPLTDVFVPLETIQPGNSVSVIHVCTTGKGKGNVDLYSASSQMSLTCSDMDHTVLPANNTISAYCTTCISCEHQIFVF